MRVFSYYSLLVSFFILLVIPSVSQAQITVTSTDDSGPGTLRQAVIDSAPSGTIDFDLSGLGAPPHTITLTSGEIVIDKSLTINGSGKNDLIISGNNSSRIFRTDAGATITFIRNLTIQDGDVRGNAGPGGQKGGGLHHTAGLLFMSDCVMSNNISGGDADGGGGAVFATSTFRAERCDITNNQTINLTGDSFGGAIDFRTIAGLLTVADSRLEGNSSISEAADGIANGGAISIIWDNISVASSNNFRNQYINNLAQGNTARGGAIYTGSTNLAMVNNTLLDNTADGVEVASGGSVFSERIAVGFLVRHDYENVTISRNTARGNIARGGGVHVISTSLNTINATISENIAEAIEGSVTPSARGGGISLFLSGSTLAANSIVFNQLRGPVGSEFIAPGFYTQGNQTIDSSYRSSLFAGNTYGRTEGVTIIGGTNCVSGPQPGGLSSPEVFPNGVNISDNDLEPDTLSPIDPGDECRLVFNPDFIATEMLGPLQNNGGLTLTHALIDTMDPLPANPAIDAIPDGDCLSFFISAERRDEAFSEINESNFDPLYDDEPLGTEIYDDLEMQDESQQHIGAGVNSPEMFEDVRGPPQGPPITTDGRPFPRPFDWNDLGTPLCDIGSFELQPLGNIVISKVADPTDLEGVFQGGATFLPEYGCDLEGMFTLADGESTAGCILPRGTYTVVEINDGLLDNVNCIGSATITSSANDPLVIVDIVDDGDNAFCAYTNNDSFAAIVSLTVILEGEGAGSAVTGTPGEIDCTSTGNMDCGQTYSPDTTVTLTATPDPGSEFVGWSGDCPATAMNDTTITLNTSSICIATFALLPVTLNVELQGTGTGNVLSDNTPPLEIDCTSTGNMDCDEIYPVGNTVTLNATADVGSTFTEWRGDAACTGDPTNPLLMLNMDMDIDCIAVFDLIPVTLTVEIQGAGEGGVTGSDTLIDCNSTGTMDCDEIYSFGDTTTLTAAPQPGSFFTGWSGDAACTGDPNNPVLDLTMDMDINCIATFELLVNLDVTIQGAGEGGVTSTPAGQIDCSNTGASDCDETYVPGSMVTLTAAAEPGSLFLAWSGDAACTGDPTNPVLNLTMNMDTSCIATFDPIPLVVLDVTIQGTGQGGVTSNPVGQIDCSNTGASDCDETYFIDSAVTLTAAAEAGSFFVGWSGDSACTGDPQNPVLNLTMNMDTSCIATFDTIPLVVLDVTIQGTGQGGVTSNPVGQIDCSNTGASDCDETYFIDSAVTLTAAAEAGSFFVGWSGDSACTGDPQNPVLNLTMNMDISCIATFDTIPTVPVTLDVVIEGNGSCTVTSLPTGIDCVDNQGDCTETYNPPGVTTDLTVIPDDDSLFTGWSGDCSGEDPDTSITVNVDSTCTATCILSEFVLNPIFPALDDNINSISAENASPGGNVAFTWARNTGSLTIGGRVCNGLELGLGNPRLLTIDRANNFGVATHIFYIPTFNDLSFQIQLQAIDIQTCRTSNIVPQIIRKDESG